jgi:hypothetical protein
MILQADKNKMNFVAYLPARFYCRGYFLVSTEIRTVKVFYWGDLSQKSTD